MARSRSNQTRRKPQQLLGIESLERRLTLSVDVSHLADGTLQILGDSAADWVRVVDLGDGSVAVSTGSRAGPPRNTQTFHQVGAIQADLGAGDDNFQFGSPGVADPRTSISVQLREGDDAANLRISRLVATELDITVRDGIGPAAGLLALRATSVAPPPGGAGPSTAVQGDVQLAVDGDRAHLSLEDFEMFGSVQVEAQGFRGVNRVLKDVSVFGLYEETILGTELSDFLQLESRRVEVGPGAALHSHVDTLGGQDVIFHLASAIDVAAGGAWEGTILAGLGRDRLTGIYEGNVDGRLHITVDSGPEVDAMFLAIIYSGSGEVGAETDQHGPRDMPVIVAKYGVPAMPGGSGARRLAVAAAIGEAEDTLRNPQLPDSVAMEVRAKITLLRTLMRDL